MTDTLTLSARVRTESGKKLAALRKAGKVPAVLYGRDLSNELLTVDGLEFARIYKAAGESTIIELTPEKGTMKAVLIHDVDFDPLSNKVIHADFYQVRMDEELETDIPLELVGEAPAVREHGGVLVKTLESVTVKCLPKNLPHSIIVDLTKIKTFDDHIQVKDLSAGAGVEILDAPDTTVALVEAPRTEAEMAALDAKVEMDVTKVEGVVKETPAPTEEKTEEKKEEK